VESNSSCHSRRSHKKAAACSFTYVARKGAASGSAIRVRAYSLQDRGSDTVDANLRLGLPVDSRDYGTGAQILGGLGVSRLRLMTNNPRKYTGLTAYGLEVVERVPLLTEPNPSNLHYLQTKRTRLGHLFDRSTLSPQEAMHDI
jgi:3,4-dihydroxy 2-butanone 4-phosphate synthase/GTP cyclohydrolase II